MYDLWLQKLLKSALLRKCSQKNLGLFLLSEKAKDFPVLGKTLNDCISETKALINLTQISKGAQFYSKMNWPVSFYLTLFYYLGKKNKDL